MALPEFNQEQVDIIEGRKDEIDDMFESVGLNMDDFIVRSRDQVVGALPDIMRTESMEEFAKCLGALYMCGVIEAIEGVTGRTPVSDTASLVAELEDGES